ncbi:MAG: hypothetical protein IIY21_04300 [Clostridiales bacterium]|nr:hypothetical protein [Clostridiales bacterium]MBQ1573893.1 hypothetical protein [Clostridiales bacterium]
MRKDEDDNFQDMRSVEGIAKTIMFCLIAMIMITSFALPIIASVGERTVDLDNTGVRVSSFNEIGWEDAMDTFSPGAYMYIGSGGLAIYGMKDGAYTTEWLINAPVDTRYPEAIIFTNNTSELTVLNYNEDSNNYTQITRRATTTVGAYTLNFPESINLWIQDPNGKHILNTGNMYTMNPSDVTGYHVSTGLTMISNTSTTKVCTGTSMVATESIVNSETSMDSGDYYTIHDISYNNIDCDYYVGPLNVYHRENILEGTQVGAMIGMIPMLMLIGIVVFVARSLNRSDR